MHPFRDGDTFATFRAQTEKVTTEINSLDNEYLLKASPAELEQYFVEKASINPLVLRSEERYIANQVGTQIDVSGDFTRAVFPGERAMVRGTKIDVAIPFEGDPILWRVRASTFSINAYTEINVGQGAIVFSVTFSDDSVDPDQVRSEIDRHTQSLVNAVAYLKSDVDSHNRSVPETVRQTLERKRKLAQAATGAVAALGIPLKRPRNPRRSRFL
jgi:hypothetical protein